LGKNYIVNRPWDFVVHPYPVQLYVFENIVSGNGLYVPVPDPPQLAPQVRHWYIDLPSANEKFLNHASHCGAHCRPYAKILWENLVEVQRPIVNFFIGDHWQPADLNFGPKNLTR
jgi:hypothetical protein